MKKNKTILSSGANLGGGTLSKKTLGRTEKKILIVSSIALILTLIIGVSYAYILYTTRQKGINNLETDCIKVEMEELTDAINLVGAYPVLDEVGERGKPFRFKLTNTCGVGVNYNFNLEVMETEEGTNRVASKYIAAKVDDLEKKLLNEDIKITDENYEYTGIEAYKLYQGELKPGASVTHELRLWLDKDADNDAQNSKFYSKVVIQSFQNQITEYQESILNGAYPVLADNLIPVEIDGTGRVTKANLSSEWYSYENKRWANAVILEDESVIYQDGEEIPESNIESYFVWIPKYSYELWDLGEYSSLTAINTSKVHTIPIKFGIENTSDSNSGECTTPMTSGSSGNCKVGDYMTPPAFITMGTNGLWVGKFEAGYKGATSTTAAQVNPSFTSATTEEQIKVYSDKIEIKSNVYSWRNIQAANAHLVSYNYKRELDSHMMKNTEWGTVAYLQHSKYGSATSVRMNNNESVITGYAAVNEPTCGYTSGKQESCNIWQSTALGVDGTYTLNYKNPNSQTASTTGNYTGIYDMSGGAMEWMMSAMLDSTNSAPLSGLNATSHSNFNGILSEGNSIANGINFPSSRYFDIYSYSTSKNAYQRRILGDATAEFGPYGNITYNSYTGTIGSWYSDIGLALNKEAMWSCRGGHIKVGNQSGMFAYDLAPGLHSLSGFRIVLAV